LNFLFIQGDGNPKFSVRDVGQMYLWELPFLVLGVFFLFRKREHSWYILPLWLAVGIIPAATAQETPHALRTEVTLPTFQILAAYGIVSSLQVIKKYQKIFIGIVSAAAVFCTVYYLHTYYVHYPVEFSGEWQYGYKDSINFVKSVANNYDHIYVQDVLGRPYIYYLFYLHIPLQEFRQTAIVKRDNFGFVDVSGFSKYSFVTNLTPLAGKALYISSAKEPVPASAKLLKTFYLLNGKPTLQAFEM
jgi:hypothetical protein